jgi:hypothetical protein
MGERLTCEWTGVWVPSFYRRPARNPGESARAVLLSAPAAASGFWTGNQTRTRFCHGYVQRRGINKIPCTIRD